VAVLAAETQVGAALWQCDTAQQFTLWREHPHAIEFGRAHAPAAPQVAFHFYAKTVRRTLARIEQHARRAQAAAIVGHVKHQYVGRSRARLYDVKLLLVRRKCQAIGAVHRVAHEFDRPGIGADAVDTRRQFLLGLLALVIADDSEGRIGEPDRAIGFHDHVIGRIQTLAPVAVGQY